MSYDDAPEAIDSRVVLRIYASLAVVATIVVFAAAWVWLTAATPLPSGPAAFGFFAALNGTFAVYAATLARVQDPADRLRGLRTFAAAHLAIAMLLWLLDGRALQLMAGDGSTTLAALAAWLPMRLAIGPLTVTGIVLLYIAYTASPGPKFRMSLRSMRGTGDPRHSVALQEKGGPSRSLHRLRSLYEEQVRQAARREERARLASDLHDAVKQQLFVIQSAAATVEARFDTDPDGARDAIARVRGATREAMTEMEAMLHQLQTTPTENVGLIAALRKQCEALGFRTGARVTFEPAALPPPPLVAPGAQQAMFRVAQEALANVGRHARATEVTVTLGERDRQLVLAVTDNGEGFDVAGHPQGMGIRNMERRAQEIGAHLDVASTPGGGTAVTFSVPFVARSARTYLLLALAFGAMSIAAGVLLLEVPGGLWLAAGRWWAFIPFWVGVVGVARYLVAFARASRAGGDTLKSR